MHKLFINVGFMHAETHQAATLVSRPAIKLYFGSSAICFNSVAAHFKVLVELQQNCGVPGIEPILVSDVCLGNHLQLDQAHEFTSTTNCCAAEYAGGELGKSGDDNLASV